MSTENLGPAMAVLNERQRAFVMALFETGGKQAAAARKAGYTGTSVAVTASQLAHSNKVRAAIREEAEKLDVSLLPIAHKMMVDVVKNPAHRDHFKAVKHVQAIAGVSPTQKHEVVHKQDTASLKAELLAAMDLLRSVAGPQLVEDPQ